MNEKDRDNAHWEHRTSRSPDTQWYFANDPSPAVPTGPGDEGGHSQNLGGRFGSGQLDVSARTENYAMK